MFVLYLNPVTANAERYVPAATCESKEALEQWVKSQRLESAFSEKVDGYSLSYKVGALRWFNPPTLSGTNCLGVPEGIVEIISRDALKNQREIEMANELEYHDQIFQGVLVVPVIQLVH